MIAVGLGACKCPEQIPCAECHYACARVQAVQVGGLGGIAGSAWFQNAARHATTGHSILAVQCRHRSTEAAVGKLATHWHLDGSKVEQWNVGGIKVWRVWHLGGGKG